MFDLARLKRVGIAVLVTAALAACNGGGVATTPTASVSHDRTRESLVGSAPTVSATLLQPLTFTLNGTVGTVSLFGTAQCGAGGSVYPTWCPGTNFTAASWTPSSTSPQSVLITMGNSSLNTSCTAPAGSPAPAPGFTPGCYVVAVEGGTTGPFLIQGPANDSGGTLSFTASSTTLSLDGETAYYFFLAYVTAIAPQPTPTPPIPSPSPLPTIYATPLPPSMTPTPAPLPGMTPTPAPTCASDDDSDTGGHHRRKQNVHKQHRGGDNDDCESDDD